MALILAIDLGKFKSVAYLYDTVVLTHTFRTLVTSPQVMHDLIVDRQGLTHVSGKSGWTAKSIARLRELSLP